MAVYLDHNAAAPLADVARAAMTTAMTTVGNPSSVHGAGRGARRVVEDARAAVAAAVGARAPDVVFTGSGTEACGLMLGLEGRPRRIVAASEHAAVLASAPGAAIAPVDADGRVVPETIAEMLGDDGRDALVAVMLANNETGVIQPIAEIARVVHDAGGLLAVDAAQAFGKIPVDLAALDADAIALSAAKIGGPAGVGAVAFRSGLTAAPLLRGGGQERGLRAGSENVIGIAGFGAAANGIAGLLARQEDVRRLRDRMEAKVAEIAPGARAAAASAPRLANTSALPMPDVPAVIQVMALDLAGFAVSAGAACSSGKVQESHVLRAMGLPSGIVGATIRVSLGPSNTVQEIDDFVAAWSELYSRKHRTNAENVTA